MSSCITTDRFSSLLTRLSSHLCLLSTVNSSPLRSKLVGAASGTVLVPSLLSSSCDSHLLPHISLSNYPINQRAIIPPLNQFRWISHRFHLRIIPHGHMRAAELPDRRLQFLYYTSPRSDSCLHFKYHRGFWLFSFCKAFRFRDTILALTSPTRCTIHFFLRMMSAFFFFLPFTLRAIKKIVTVIASKAVVTRA